MIEFQLQVSCGLLGPCKPWQSLPGSDVKVKWGHDSSEADLAQSDVRRKAVEEAEAAPEVKEGDKAGQVWASCIAVLCLARFAKLP